MADQRFFPKSGPFTLRHLAQLTGATLAHAEGEEDRLFQDVAPLDRAGESDISFLDNTRYVESFATSKAGACFVRGKFAERAPQGMALFLCDEPYYAYALTAQAFYPAQRKTGFISPHAFIDPTARIGDQAHIAPGAVIEAGAVIGAHCSIGPGAVIHERVSLGEECQIGANSTLSHCQLGKRVIVHRGVHIGQDGFGYASSKTGAIKVPQLGRVVIEDDVEIGSGTCIDRGTGPDTVIGQGTKIDNLVQIGHNVQIGRHAIIVAQAGIAGSSRIGDGTVLGGQVGISGHLKIGAGAKIAAQSGVMGDIPPGAAYGGSPAVPVKDWHRQTIAVARLTKDKREAS